MNRTPKHLNDSRTPAQGGHQHGFTIIELVMVIVILGILAALALPRLAAFQDDARIATLEGIAGAMESTIAIVKTRAYASGLSLATSNPGNQAAYVVETEAGRSEVDWRNLCPESRAELADTLTMLDHISLDGNNLPGGLRVDLSNQYTRIGYEIAGSGRPGSDRCYVEYDSFGSRNLSDPPTCPVTIDRNCAS